MEIPRLGVKLKLQLPAYTTATATPDPSCICDLHHHSSQQCQILKMEICLFVLLFRTAHAAYGSFQARG